MNTPCPVDVALDAYLRSQEDMVPSVYYAAHEQATAELVKTAIHDPDWIGDAVNEVEVLEAIQNLLNGIEAGREPEQLAGLSYLFESAVRRTLERYLSEEINERACEIYPQVLTTGEK